jgi:hypothetical protein
MPVIFLEMSCARRFFEAVNRLRELEFADTFSQCWLRKHIDVGATGEECLCAPFAASARRRRVAHYLTRYRGRFGENDATR